MVSIEDIKNWTYDWATESGIFLVEILKKKDRFEVFIDKPEGITIDECSKLSRYLSKKIEELTEVPFELLVSSPGMDKPFRVNEQYLKNIGKKVRIIMQEGETHEGKILQTHENEITIEITKGESKKKELTNLILNINHIQQTKLII